MICPNCGHDNIAGTDLCRRCGTDLAGLDLPEAGAGFRGRLLSDRVDQLPMAPPLAVAPDSTVAQAIRMMRAERHGCVLVEDASGLCGIFTERDVLSRVVWPGSDPEKVTVGAVMTSEPITLAPDDPPAFAIHLTVARGLRHLPVTSDGRVLGFISVRHILRYLHDDLISNLERE